MVFDEQPVCQPYRYRQVMARPERISASDFAPRVSSWTRRGDRTGTDCFWPQASLTLQRPSSPKLHHRQLEQLATLTTPHASLVPAIMTPTTPPALQGPTSKEKKYDRQLRLWAASGQQALEDAHILLVNSGPGVAGIETLKNLVLPGELQLLLMLNQQY